ncbi:hypothetical protein ACFLXB_01905 [Chloroflexota bacterium]
MRTKFASLILLIFLAGCSPSGEKTPTKVDPNGPSPTEVVTEALTPTASSPLAILVIPSDMPKKEADIYQAAINDLAVASGLRFQVRNSLTSTDFDFEPNLKIVVVFPPDPGLSQLAANAPQVQFLAVTIPGLEVADNLSVVGAQGTPVENQAFMAGYIASMLSQDFRVGIINQKNTPTGNLAYNAFFNGMTFYCGLCNPMFPPWYEYPVHSDIPADVNPEQYRFYADPLKDYLADYAYVLPMVADIDLLDALAQYDINIISESLPADRLTPNWVVSIKPEVIPAIQSIWADLLAGNSGQDLPLPLFLTDVNPDLLSEGKLADVQLILDRLQRGEIDPLSAP